MQAHKEQRLCFNYDKQYLSGHQCHQSHILLLLIEDDFIDASPEFEALPPLEPDLM